MNKNPLSDFFENHDDLVMTKWSHYFDIYHKHFSVFQNTNPTIVEFGVYQGGSLQMWKKYFGPGARIIGVDINPQCKALREMGIEIFIGDQEDRGFLRELAAAVGEIQVLIDDGGHKMKQQIATFEEMYPVVTIPGVYLAEDIHTSYWEKFGGGYRWRRSFMEYAKRLTDKLNAWHINQPIVEKQPPGRVLRKFIIDMMGGKKPQVDDFTRSTHGIHFYDSVIVLEKKKVNKAESLEAGSKKLY